jgi:hypothetical protein
MGSIIFTPNVAGIDGRIALFVTAGMNATDRATRDGSLIAGIVSQWSFRVDGGGDNLGGHHGSFHERCFQRR